MVCGVKNVSVKLRASVLGSTGQPGWCDAPKWGANGKKLSPEIKPKFPGRTTVTSTLRAWPDPGVGSHLGITSQVTSDAQWQVKAKPYLWLMKLKEGWEEMEIIVVQVEVCSVELQKKGSFCIRTALCSPSHSPDTLTRLLSLFSSASQGQSQPVQVLCCTTHHIVNRIILQPAFRLLHNL